MSARVLCGDALEQLRTLPDESVQCVVTSPPYWNLRDYGTSSWEGGDPECAHAIERVGDPRNPKAGAPHGKPKKGEELNRRECRCGAMRVDKQIGLESTVDDWVAKLVEVFREVRRVLRADGSLWLNLGDSYAGNGGQSPQSGEIFEGRVRQRENICLSSRAKGGGLKSKDLVGQPWRVAFALQADGWYLRQDIIWHKPNPMPESVRDRCTKAHEYVFLMSKAERYYFDADAISEESSPDTSPRLAGNRSHKGTLAYEDGAEQHRTKAGLVAYAERQRKVAAARSGTKNKDSFDDAMAVMPERRNRRDVWTIGSEPYPEAHFATFPSELPRVCIAAGSKPGDTVLDPFAGSGTTLQVALDLGRAAIGIELNPEYVRLIEKRLARTTVALPLRVCA